MRYEIRIWTTYVGHAGHTYADLCQGMIRGIAIRTAAFLLIR
jgi:hypothetical protein